MWFIAILCIAGLLVGFWYARKAFADWYGEDESGPTAGFSIGDLRDLRRQGKISEEEFERTKAMVIDSAKRAASAPPKKPRLRSPSCATSAKRHGVTFPAAPRSAVASRRSPSRASAPTPRCSRLPSPSAARR